MNEDVAYGEDLFSTDVRQKEIYSSFYLKVDVNGEIISLRHKPYVRLNENRMGNVELKA